MKTVQGVKINQVSVMIKWGIELVKKDKRVFVIQDSHSVHSAIVRPTAKLQQHITSEMSSIG